MSDIQGSVGETAPAVPFCEAAPGGRLCGRPATHLSFFRPAWEYAHHCGEHAHGDGWKATPLQWRNKEDRQVITARPDGTGVTAKGATVSVENMRLVRSGVFWELLS